MAKNQLEPIRIVEEGDVAYEVDSAGEDIEDMKTRQINPIIVNDGDALNEEDWLEDCKKPQRRENNQKYQLYIRYRGPRVLLTEIKELHPDIISVKVLRRKGRCFVNFCNEQQRDEALEELKSKEINGYKLRVYKCKPQTVCKLPFSCAR